MDLASTLIGLGVLAICVLPMGYLHWMRGVRVKKFRKEFLATAGEHQLKFDESVTWNNWYGLGLDNSSNRLFYYKSREGELHKELIDLKQVKSCKAQKITAGVKVNNSVDSTIDRLELQIKFTNPAHAAKTLEFYNSDNNEPLDNEIVLMDRWAALINAGLNIPKK